MENKLIRPRKNNSIVIKIIFILFMILLLMIPNFLIQNLIHERSSRKTEIENEVAKSYGQKQKVMSPILRIPYSKSNTNSKGEIYYTNGTVSFTPNETTIDGNIITDTRKRSIYEVVIYDSEIKIKSDIPITKLDATTYHGYKLDYTKAYLAIGISDPNGLSDATTINVNGKPIALDGMSDIVCPNLRFVKTLPFTILPNGTVDITTNLILKGTKSLLFEPIGNKLDIKLKSPWADPSFVGTKLPNSHDITSEGFAGKWVVNKYAHNYPKTWTNDASTLKQNFAFGVNLIQPIDEYGKNSRTAKYALLIIALTFGIFFFFEILFKKLIHPIQYALVGFALTIFFLLLLSITEHLGFDLAYLMSSIATVGLIVGYASFILDSKKATIILALLLAGLFGYIFIILQMQDFALLAGAIALFAVLAIVMILSRKVNWYELSRGEN